jgi:hypothetical protein
VSAPEQIPPVAHAWPIPGGAEQMPPEQVSPAAQPVLVPVQVVLQALVLHE